MIGPSLGNSLDLGSLSVLEAEMLAFLAGSASEPGKGWVPTLLSDPQNNLQIRNGTISFLMDFTSSMEVFYKMFIKASALRIKT